MRFTDNEALDPSLYEELARQYVLRTSPQRPIYVKRADGVRFWDQHGKGYLDFTSKAVCVNLGFGRHEITEALHQQLDLASFSAPYELNPRQVELAAVMAKIAPAPLRRAVFYASGSEAIESALKIARRATGRSKIVSHYGSYHGTTQGALAASGAPAYTRSFDSRASGFIHLQAPDTLRGVALDVYIRELEATVGYEDPSQIAAFLVEPMLSGGVLGLPRPYLARLRELASEFGILLIFDEIISGFGRTGTMFYCEQAGVTPDILVGAKGMSSSYVPCSVVMVSEEVANLLGVVSDADFDTYLSHGYHLSTSQNHPLACASALATIDYIIETGLLPEVTSMGRRLAAGLTKIASSRDTLTRPRGIGLFAGVEVVGADPLVGDPELAERIVREAEQRGLIIGAMRNRLPNSSILITAPPLTVAASEIDEALSILDAAVSASGA